MLYTPCEDDGVGIGLGGGILWRKYMRVLLGTTKTARMEMTVKICDEDR